MASTKVEMRVLQVPMILEIIDQMLCVDANLHCRHLLSLLKHHEVINLFRVRLQDIRLDLLVDPLLQLVRLCLQPAPQLLLLLKLLQSQITVNLKSILLANRKYVRKGVDMEGQLWHKSFLRWRKILDLVGEPMVFFRFQSRYIYELA